MGSINFSIHPIVDRYKDEDYKYPWEKDFAAATKDFIFRNTFGDIEKLVQIMTENNTKSEFEVYDVGHLYNINFLIRKKVIEARRSGCKFVTGILGGIGANVGQKWCTSSKLLTGVLRNGELCLVRHRAGYPGGVQSWNPRHDHGGNARVGMEDNIFVEKGVLCKSNGELVEKMVRIAKELGREVATPDEARKILGLKGKENVNY